jgi:hypothetical protein
LPRPVPALLLALGAVAALAIGVLAAVHGWSAARARPVIEADTFTVRGDPRAPVLPLARLKPYAVRHLDAADPGAQLASGDGGVRAFGYASGWFRDGRGERVLAFVREGEGIVRVPVEGGPVLLVSSPQPEALVAVLAAQHTRFRD